MFLIGGGVLMQVEGFQHLVDADDVSTQIAKAVAIVSAFLFIVERGLKMLQNHKKSNMDLYEKKREIDSKYDKK